MTKTSAACRSAAVRTLTGPAIEAKETQEAQVRTSSPRNPREEELLSWHQGLTRVLSFTADEITSFRLSQRNMTKPIDLGLLTFCFEIYGFLLVTAGLVQHRTICAPSVIPETKHSSAGNFHWAPDLLKVSFLS